MTGAMYAAVAGLKSHMNKLNVIGNNVANVNTNAYKAGRMTFKESLYSTSRSGSNGTATRGGNNPSQIGYGATVGTIDLDMSTKNYMPTGVNLDCMIDGSGFFMVGDKLADGEIKDAQDLELTRMGNFTFDADGYMVDGNNRIVYGYVTCAVNADDGEKGDKLGIGNKEKPQYSTQLVPIRLPLSSKGNTGIKDGTALYPGVGDTGLNVSTGDLVTNGPISCNVDSISIDGATGKITATNNADNSQIVVGYIGMASVANPNGVSHVEGPYYRAGEGAGKCLAASFGGAVTGKLNNSEEDADQDVLSSGGTYLIPNGLESSGTDLATEISEMITTQRGYQANTRIITVTDSMLEELVNMKR